MGRKPIGRRALSVSQRKAQQRAKARGVCIFCDGQGIVPQSPDSPSDTCPCKYCRPRQAADFAAPLPLPDGLTDTGMRAMEASVLHLPSRP